MLIVPTSMTMKTYLLEQEYEMKCIPNAQELRRVLQDDMGTIHFGFEKKIIYFSENHQIK